MVEPNRVAYSYYGVATGKGKQAAKTELEKLNLNKERALLPWRSSMCQDSDLVASRKQGQ
jgi:20S proteasome alpha/beta subunit